MDSFQNPCNFISFWHHQDIFFRDCTDQQDNNQIYHSGCGDCQQGNNFAVRNFGDQVSCSAAEKGRNQRLPEYFKIVEADSGYLCQPDQAEPVSYTHLEFDDDEECDCCDCDDDEELYEVTCPECGETVYLDADMPVSYTHLDVYKRQRTAEPVCAASD